MLRILFLGQKWLGEKCFDLLQNIQSDLVKVCGAVSNMRCDVWWKSNHIYQRCHAQGIPFIDNRKRNHEVIGKMIADQKINTLVSVQHPWVIFAETLAQVDFHAFNLHNAKLPEYQGHNTCNHAILNGERFYTSSLHWMSPEVDRGSIAFEETIEIKTDSARSLYDRALVSGQSVFKALLEHWLHGWPIPRKAITGQGVFYPRNSLDSLREIRNIADREEVDLKSRALFFPPFEPAFFQIDGRKQYVLPADFYLFLGEFENKPR